MKEFEIPYPVSKPLSEDEMRKGAAKALGVPIAKIGEVKIIKRSLDARSKEIVYRYRLLAATKDEKLPDETLPPFKRVEKAPPVIIIGSGPAGLFAAIKLIQIGFKPVIIERGNPVRERKRDIATLYKEALVNSDSNYCFGEGGAGAFSDGKLYTRSSKRGDVTEVLRYLVTFGADETILYEAHPHIGSDLLPRLLENARKTLLEYGGEFHFGLRVTDMERKGGEWRVICKKIENNSIESFSANQVILASGHSARDIYELFAARGWALEPKGFAMGVRVEHPQHLINEIQYGATPANYLPPSEYSLVSQVEGRGVFSFCMCPGGILVPASTAPGELVLNGMSTSLRNSKWANAGVVVSIEPQDVSPNSPPTALQMLDFQKSMEIASFNATSSLKAPAQRMTDFVHSKKGKQVVSSKLPSTSYIPGAVGFPLDEILPEVIALKLKKAFPLFNQKMKGYYTSEALLLGVESRTSSPIRIPRNPETLQHINLEGLYPCGEGAGYAGGIVSSALDGINCALKIGERGEV